MNAFRCADHGLANVELATGLCSASVCETRRMNSTGRPSAAKLLTTPDALLTRSDLRELGLERRAVDAVFRSLPVVVLPGYTRPMIKAGDYVDLIERSTYDGSRVR